MRQIKRRFILELSEKYPKEEAEELFFMAMEHILGVNKTAVVIALWGKASKKAEVQAMKTLARLKNDEPIQYILGEAEFMGRRYKVNRSTLIPRPETALLVENAVIEAKRILEQQSVVSVLDIGTGTGIIAISLALELGERVKVEAIDISNDALEVAKENAERLGANVDFKQIDILGNEAETLGRYDLIVSNPPYIRPSEKEGMRRNVLDYEPSTALFIPEDDPLLFYREITNFAHNKNAGGHLNPNGAVVFEINEAFGKETSEKIKQFGFTNVAITKDIYEKDRTITARL